MAQLTRIGVGGAGRTYGTITDKVSGVSPRPGDILTRIGVGGVSQNYTVTDKDGVVIGRPGNLFTRIGIGGIGITYGTISDKTESEAEIQQEGGVKRLYFEDVEPLWKQKEYKPDWIDLEIKKELRKLYKPDIIDVSSILDEELAEFKQQQEIKRKKRNRKKALHMLLSGL